MPTHIPPPSIRSWGQVLLSYFILTAICRLSKLVMLPEVLTCLYLLCRQFHRPCCRSLSPPACQGHTLETPRPRLSPHSLAFSHSFFRVNSAPSVSRSQEPHTVLSITAVCTFMVLRMCASKCYHFVLILYPKSSALASKVFTRLIMLP